MNQTKKFQKRLYALVLALTVATLLFQTGCWKGSVFGPAVTTVVKDPAGHAQYITMPADITLTLLELFSGTRSNGFTPQATSQPDQVQVTGPFPWVTVSGPLNLDGTFSLTGTGTVAGYSSVAVTFIGTVDQTGKITGQYSMGTNGALPTGQAIVYSITGQVPIPPGTPLISPKPNIVQFAAKQGTNPATQVVQIANGGTGTLGWTAQVSTESGGNWLSLDSAAAVAPSNVTVTVNSASLARGNYKGKITVTGLPLSAVPNSPLSVPVELAVDTPLVNDKGVINGASFSKDAVVGVNSIASLFGSQLASSTAAATALPLLTTLGGVQLLVNGVAAPLFFVSATQINFQMPPGLTGTTVQIQVVSGGLTGLPSSATIAPEDPGIFTANQQGTGQGAVLNEDFSANSAQAPAARGSAIQIFATGLGTVDPPVAAGQPASGTTLSRTTKTPTVLINGASAEVLFSGLAPGFVGLYQINVRVPPNTPAGQAISLQIQIGGRNSNTATFVVQ